MKEDLKAKLQILSIRDIGAILSKVPEAVSNRSS
jgi:hypothetical protein